MQIAVALGCNIRSTQTILSRLKRNGLVRNVERADTPCAAQVDGVCNFLLPGLTKQSALSLRLCFLQSCRFKPSQRLTSSNQLD